MTNENPAAVNGGNRCIRITDWKPHPKGSLVGFFSASLPSGMVIHSLMLHAKGTARWIAFSAREWTDEAAQRQYSRLIEFTDRQVADRFCDQVLAALDAHLVAGSGK
jgi:hypothetical protein